MTAWQQGIDLAVDVGFDTDPFDAFVAPTDVSTDLRGLRIFHGRTSIDSGLGVSELNLTLGSRARQYDPDYAAGAHFGDLVKGKRVAVGVTLGAFSATLFTGFALRWNHHLFFQKDAVAEVPCSAGNNALDSTPLPASAYSQEVIVDSPVAYWPLQGGDTSGRVGPSLDPVQASTVSLSDVGFPVGESDGVVVSTESTSVAGSAEIRSTSSPPAQMPFALEAWVSIPGTTNANYTRLVVDAPGTTDYWFIDVYDVGEVWLSYSHSGDNRRYVSGSAPVLVGELGAGVFHLAAYRTSTTMTFMVNGSVWQTVTFAVGTAGSSSTVAYSVIWGVADITLPFPAVGHYAVYDSAPSADRLNAHYNVGRWAWTGAHGIYGWEYGGARIGRVLDDCDWPAADRDINTGGTSQGPYLPAAGNAVDYMHQVELSEQGVVCFDTQGRVRFVDRQTLWTTTPVCTFSDDGAASAVKFSELELDTGEVYNIVTATWSNGTTGGAVTVRDQTSIDSHTAGHNTIDPGTTVADAQTASTLAAYRLREDKNPVAYPRVLRCHVRNPSATVVAVQVEALCTLELGDVVAVEYTPMGLGAQTVKRAIVLGIEHDITLEEWEVVVHLAPAPTSATNGPYLTLGNATTGKIGVTAGNLIPF